MKLFFWAKGNIYHWYIGSGGPICLVDHILCTERIGFNQVNVHLKFYRKLHTRILKVSKIIFHKNPWRKTIQEFHVFWIGFEFVTLHTHLRGVSGSNSTTLCNFVMEMVMKSYERNWTREIIIFPSIRHAILLSLNHADKMRPHQKVSCTKWDAPELHWRRSRKITKMNLCCFDPIDNEVEGNKTNKIKQTKIVNIVSGWEITRGGLQREGRKGRSLGETCKRKGMKEGREDRIMCNRNGRKGRIPEKVSYHKSIKNPL